MLFIIITSSFILFNIQFIHQLHSYFIIIYDVLRIPFSSVSRISKTYSYGRWFVDNADARSAVGWRRPTRTRCARTSTNALKPRNSATTGRVETRATVTTATVNPATAVRCAPCGRRTPRCSSRPAPSLPSSSVHLLCFVSAEWLITQLQYLCQFMIFSLIVNKYYYYYYIYYYYYYALI